MRTQSVESPLPTTPVRAVWKSVLSQDVITTATIPVDPISASPVAVFTNKSNPEALAIVNTGKGRQLCHVARHSAKGNDAGWQATPLFDGQLAEQVAAGVAYAGSSSEKVCGLFLHDNTLHCTMLDGDGQWSKPSAVGAAPMTKMRVAYSPQRRMIVYGADAAGNLITAYQPQIDGAFVSTECSVNGALTGNDFQLCMTDEQSWTIVANVDRQAMLITGTLGAKASSSYGPAAGFGGTAKHVALGYWNSAQNTLIFLIVGEDDALHAWSQGQADSEARVQKIPNGKSVSQAAGHVAENGLLHVYAVDDDERLWTLHQSPDDPWHDDGTPNWAPMLALDKGVARIAGDINPMAAPALFGLSAGDYSLRLHALDEGSRLWKSDQVLQHSPHAFEVPRFRTEVSLIDKNGWARPRHPVTLATEKGASKVDVWASGAVHTIDENGVALTTDVTGKLTFAVLATDGLACPNFVVSSDVLEQPVTVEPAGETHRYLAGEINALHRTNPGGPLPRFDENGETLKNAKVNGIPLAAGAANSDLAGVAAKAIRGAAATAISPGKLTRAGVYGFAGSLSAQAPRFQTFNSAEQLHAHKLALRAGVAQGTLGDVDIGAFFGDLLEGIKNGVIAIVDFVVDVGKKTADLVLQIGEWFHHVADLALEGLEKVGAFIAGVFHAIEAAVEKVVDWLKALFDFKAIWHTKMALEQGLLKVPQYVSGLAREGQKYTHAWFAKQKSAIDQSFETMKAQYAGQSFAAQPGWQDPGAPSDKPIAGNVSPADCTNDTHHNWLHDKVTSYSSDASFFTPKPREDDPWKPVADCLATAGEDFTEALAEFRNGVAATIEDPSSFATLAIPHFLGMVQKLIDTALDLGDAAAQAFLALAITVMEELEALLAAELPLGPLNALWQWIAEQAGYPNDGKLTAAALVALVAAFPVTLVYKLFKGVENEPFREGKLPNVTAKRGLLGADDWPIECREVSSILRIIQFFPESFADGLGSACPTWLTLVGLGFSAVIWFLAHGFPDFAVIEWAVAGGSAAALWLIPVALVILRTELTVTRLANAIAPFKDDAIAFLTTLAGIWLLGFGIIRIVVQQPPPSAAVANILSPLDSLFAWLALNEIRASPAAPYAIGAQVAIDMVACVGGGGAQFLSLTQAKASV